jgi:phage recombination protein Bet
MSVAAAVELADRPQPLSLTQLDLIKRTLASQVMTDDELALFAQICSRTRLDPFRHQIWATWIGKEKKRFQPLVGIEGFRAIAQRSGHYAGQLPVEWCGPDGKWVDVWTSPDAPAAARAAVLRKDWTQPMVAVALFSEYTTGQGRWTTARAFQIGKCAEALALRKSFTEDLSGLYTDDELDNVADTAEPPPPPARAVYDDDGSMVAEDHRTFLSYALDNLGPNAKAWLLPIKNADKIPSVAADYFKNAHRDRLAWHILHAQQITEPEADADEPVPAHVHHDDTSPEAYERPPKYDPDDAAPRGRPMP